MTRFLLFLFGKAGYEPCKSCETLKQQLAIVTHEKSLLTDTLLDILKPRLTEAVPREVANIKPMANIWSKRREILEAADREEARLKRESGLIARPDKLPLRGVHSSSNVRQDTANNAKAIEELEKELGVEDAASTG